MRVAFDSSPFRYDPATGRGPSGVAKWSLGALSALAGLEPGWELVGVSPGFDPPTLPPANIGPNVSYRRIPMPRRLHHLVELARFEPRIETWTGPVDAVLGNVFVTARSRRAASIPIFYDMSLLKHPELHPPRRRAYVTPQLNRVVREATVLVTISETVKSEIAGYYGIPQGRVFVAPPSWEPVVFPHRGGGGVDPAGQLSGDYLLFVGTVEPRKNILGLLKALEALKLRRAGVPPLALVGGPGWGYEVFGELLEASAASGAVIRLGYVSDTYMGALYRNAAALVYPSLYEGFGMPILEAMAAGCPVLTSDVPSTAETAGGAALLVDPHDPVEIAAGIERLLDDAELRRDLSEKGLERAKGFSWESTGAQLALAIEEAVRLAAGT